MEPPEVREFERFTPREASQFSVLPNSMSLTEEPGLCLK
jgi:hypothetical protein